MKMKNRGVDIGTIQEVLGHANPAVTEPILTHNLTAKTLRTVRERMQL